jgi:ERI1 exoribonuclease 2
MCNVAKLYRKSYPYKSEIIQIGAVLLAENLEVTDKFNEYVKPKYGDLDHFIKKLTGISKLDLSRADEFPVVFERFSEWIPKENVAMVSWSMTDRSQLIKETEAKKIPMDEYFNLLLESWFDCQLQFAEKMDMGTKQYSLEEALIATDVCADGRAHDGLADALNTALLFAKMQKEEKLVLNPYYKRAHDGHKEEHLTYTMADVIEEALKKKKK